MSWKITVPENAIKYIVLQRTAYLVLPRNRFIAKLINLSPESVYDFVVTFETARRKNRIKQLFREDMLAEYNSIKTWLPNNVSAILDIGCGVGGIDVLLHKHYNLNPRIKFYLLDKSHVERKIFYGFKKRGAFYNSLEVSQRLLVQNGIAQKNIYTLEAAPDFHIDLKTDIELVISLLSWGFHYPVSTYINQVYKVMRRDGRLILDIRRGTEGERELASKFSKVQVLFTDEKKIRVLAVK